MCNFMKHVTKVTHHSSQAFFSRLGNGISALVVLFGVIGAAHKGCPQEPGGLPDAPQQKSLPVQLPPAESSSSDASIPDNPLPSLQARIEDKVESQLLSRKQKFVFATGNAFGIPSVFFAAAGARVNQAQKLYPGFHL
jgi:hypothetical protein